MSFLNGQSNSSETSQRGEKGDRGISFSLTADEHYHIKNERLTKVSAPIDNNDVTTKKIVTVFLETKAGTSYVRNEFAIVNAALALKASQSNVNAALAFKAD